MTIVQRVCWMTTFVVVSAWAVAGAVYYGSPTVIAANTVSVTCLLLIELLRWRRDDAA